MQATKSPDLVELGDALRDVMARGRRLAVTSDHEKSVFALLAHLINLGPLRSSDLADRACLDLSTVSRHLRALEDEGYVSRTPDPDDGRAHLLVVTPAGRRLVREARERWVTVLADATADWPATDRFELIRLTRRLADSLETL